MSIRCLLRSRRLAEDPNLVDAHVSSCLRCQVEAVRYRALRRALAALRTESVVAPVGLVTVVTSSLGTGPPVPKKSAALETAAAAAGLAAVAVALWRRTLSA